MLEPIFVEAEAFTRVSAHAVVSVDYINTSELERMAQATLGETLSWQAGISSSYFSPGASRPVIRGFEGFRVRMLQDGIGTLDVSETSPDHGVALEPLLIREIDIHRGPSALLFGNSAIGGAVNSSTRAFAQELPEQHLTGSLETRYESASEGHTLAGYTQLTQGDIVVTLGGSTRDAQDYAIPGKGRTTAYETTFEPLVNDPPSGSTVPIVNPSGTLPNTFHNSDSGLIAIGWLPTDNPIALQAAYSRYDSRYGIPYQYGGDANDLFGYSSLGLRHERFDLSTRLNPDLAWLDALQLHIGYADYQHTELFTGLGKDADKHYDDTQFDQHALEARLEWYHQPFDWLLGLWGIHTQHYDLAASFLAAPPREDSRFLNRFETGNHAAFAMETLKLGDFTLQAGLRYETQKILDTSLENFDIITNSKDNSTSYAASLTWRRKNLSIFDEIAITPAASLIERIPTATERFAFWPNPAIQRFLIGGDKDGTPLGKERSIGTEIGLEGRIRKFSGRLNAYYYSFDNFIFLQDIKGQGNLAQYLERKATFYGAEGELTWHKQITDNGGTLTLNLMSDYVRGHNETDNQPLPRIPPFRIGTRAELAWHKTQAGAEYRYAFAQDRLQPETSTVLPELETSSYSELNLDFSRDFAMRTAKLTTFLRATNLLNEERRIHTSFLKDVAPLPSRSISLGIRLQY